MGGKINGKRGFSTKAPLQKSGNDVKSTNSQKGREAQPPTSLEKFCTNPDGVMAFCKRKMAESAKNHPPFLRGRGGGGGTIFGQNSANQKKTFTFSHLYIYNAASFRWKEKTVLDRQQPRPTAISGSSSK